MHKNTWHSAWWQWKLNMNCVHDYGRWSPKTAPSTPLSPDGHAPTLNRWRRFPSPWTWAGLRLALDKRKHRSDLHRAPSGTNSGTSGSLCFCALWGNQPPCWHKAYAQPPKDKAPCGGHQMKGWRFLVPSSWAQLPVECSWKGSQLTSQAEENHLAQFPGNLQVRYRTYRIR